MKVGKGLLYASPLLAAGAAEWQRRGKNRAQERIKRLEAEAAEEKAMHDSEMKEALLRQHKTQRQLDALLQINERSAKRFGAVQAMPPHGTGGGEEVRWPGA